MTSILETQEQMASIEARITDLMETGTGAIIRKIRLTQAGHKTDVETLLQASCQVEMVRLRNRYRRLRLQKARMEWEGRMTVRAVEEWLRNGGDNG